MQILFDRLSHKVVGLNRSPLPFEYSLELEGTPVLYKTITRVVGREQKVNEEGLPLYHFEGEEVTFPEKIVEAVYSENSRQEDLDGDGLDETVISKELVTPESVIILEPVTVDVFESFSVSFTENPFEFYFEEVSNAKLAISLEKRVEMENSSLQLALVEQYELNLKLKADNENAMLAVAEIYELFLGGME